ncbi:MAG: hypothetical protein ABJI00_14155 [Paracoccaceae bacterium]
MSLVLPLPPPRLLLLMLVQLTMLLVLMLVLLTNFASIEISKPNVTDAFDRIRRFSFVFVQVNNPYFPSVMHR